MSDDHHEGAEEEDLEELEDDEELEGDDGEGGEGYPVRGRGRGRGYRGGRGGFRGRGYRGGPPMAGRGGGRGRAQSGFRPRGSIHNRVYVGNLSYQTSWQDLKDHMRNAGEVTFAEVFMDEQGRSKGCGVVEFVKAEEAQNAIKTMADTKVEGTERKIFVREDRVDTFDEGFRGGGYGRGGFVPRGGRGYAPRGAYAPHVVRGGYGGYAPGGYPVHHQYGYQAPVRGGYMPGGGRGGYAPPAVRGGYAPQAARGGYAPGMRGGYAPPARGGYTGRGRGGPPVDGLKQGRQVFVGNLPYHTSWQDLKDLFSEIGPVLRSDILYGMDGRPKGMGTVCFESAESAQKAIEKMSEYEYDGRTIHVSEDKYAV